MMQDILARHLNLPEHDVRVICKDVGGSFGIKVHIYPDEMATCALSVLLGRPVKFVGGPPGVVPVRHPRPRSSRRRRDRGRARRDDTRDAGGRPHRHRPLLGLSAHERGGGQPDHPAHAGRVPLPRLRGPPARRVPEQDAHVPVPGGGPSHRVRGDGGHGGPGGARAGPRPGGGAAQELRDRRDVPAYVADRLLLRAPLARGVPGPASSPSPTTGRGPPSATTCGSQGRLPGAGPLRLHRADHAGPRVLRRGRGAHLLAGRLHAQARAVAAPSRASPASPSRGRGRTRCSPRWWRPSVGVPIEDVRVLTGDTLVSPYGGGTWASRGAGIGGRGGAADGQGAQGQCAARRRAPCSGASPTSSISAAARWWTATPARCGWTWPSWAASRTSGRTRSRRIFRPS